MSVNRSIVIRPAGERGVALIMTLLVMALMSALMIGFSAVVMSDQRYRYIDRDRVRAFYAAQSGLEKLSADLANLFFENVAPTEQQIADLGKNPPSVPDVKFTTGTTSGVAYGATYIPPEAGEQEWNNISSGPYEGLIALKKRYWLDSSVQTAGGGQAHVRRKIETVAIPIFQFGIFSEVNLSFSAADTFTFGGRVHTNNNLFLAQGGSGCSPSPCTLWLGDRVTAVKEIIREFLSNGVSIDTTNSTQRVRVATAPNAWRDLKRTEGSLVGDVGSAANNGWPTLSLSSYNGYLRTGKTGAKQLNLPIIKKEAGGENIDLIRRPLATGNEKAALLAERYFSKVSLRILLSDTEQDIMQLPTVTSTPPVSLESTTVAGHPIARSTGYNETITQINKSGGVAAANGVDVPVDNIPGYFKLLPELTVTPAAGAPVTVQCSGKSANASTNTYKFLGCVPAGSVAAPATVSATVEGVSVSTNLVTWSGGEMTVGATEDFSPNTFWVLNTNDTNVLVSCTGYTGLKFTGCRVPADLQDNAKVTSGALTDQLSTIGGFIKIEMQDTEKKWRDVTMEILGYGFAGPNLRGRGCGDPTPKAILRLQRRQDNNEATGGTDCSYTNVPRPTYYWPNVLFDTREAVYRDVPPGGDEDAHPLLGGVMHYVALDVANLSKWFKGESGFEAGNGSEALTDGTLGYSVYFSDRRNNRDETGKETGEYGFEDVVNPQDASGTPNGVLDAGEDMNGSLGTKPQTYGQFPSFDGHKETEPTGGREALDQALARPRKDIRAPQAQVNRAVLFRRALKLTNGGIVNGVNSIIAPGLTIAAENPVYIQGDWNATAAATATASFAGDNVATSVVADAVTLLSNGWNDSTSFANPYQTSGRPRSAATAYRVAIIAGKGPIFPKPAAGAGGTFGTDGGVHSFLRFLEGDGKVFYRGSMATLYYHRQAVSPFKCCGGVVYDVPQRDYTFDTDFLDPALLPPLTPMFRDLNALGFTQETRPGK